MVVGNKLYFLAMFSIFCFFFRRGREEEDVPTREEVDWETYRKRGLNLVAMHLFLHCVVTFDSLRVKAS